MTNHEKRFVGLLGLALAGGLLWGASRFGGAAPNPALFRAVPAFLPPLHTVPGNGSARFWLDSGLARLRVISDFGRVAWDGRILAVLSARDHRLREYDLRGHRIGPAGGWGTPPDGNGGLPTAFALGARGRWFADANAPSGGGPAQLSRAAHGEAVRAMGIAVAAREIFLLLPLSAGKMFAAVRLPSGQETRFGRILRHQAEDGVEAFGDMAIDARRGVLYYAATYVGLVGAWNASGQRIFLRRTVAPLPPPKLVHVVGGARIPFRALYSSLDLAYSDGVVYLLTEVPPGAKLPTAVLDEYSGKTGAYLGSLRLPERCGQFAIRGNILATSSVHGTTVWRILRQ